ncbi:MAG TPA: hypothetical protein VFW19_14650 [Allosphingosinicella sp.]|nr:hypothetical protein [Allosphingosinicella sp.]
MAESNPSQRLEIENVTTSILEIMVEIRPKRYLLNPGDKMLIEAELNGVPFSVAVYEGGLQIYAGNDVDPPVKINGVPVKPDWDTKI